MIFFLARLFSQHGQVTRDAIVPEHTHCDRATVQFLVKSTRGKNEETLGSCGKKQKRNSPFIVRTVHDHTIHKWKSFSWCDTSKDIRDVNVSRDFEIFRCAYLAFVTFFHLFAASRWYLSTIFSPIYATNSLVRDRHFLASTNNASVAEQRILFTSNRSNRFNHSDEIQTPVRSPRRKEGRTRDSLRADVYTRVESLVHNDEGGVRREYDATRRRKKAIEKRWSFESLWRTRDAKEIAGARWDTCRFSHKILFSFNRAVVEVT